MLKELIQNADDSSATEFHLAWLPGESEAAHPLLRVPALLALNNGLFRENDAKGIRRIRLGTKAGDLRSIGKFGLGLKSVFHLCEAWLCIGSSSEEGILAGHLNPWAPKEQEWTCPCHGSRFSPNGEIMEGPADEPLRATAWHEYLLRHRQGREGGKPIDRRCRRRAAH